MDFRDLGAILLLSLLATIHMLTTLPRLILPGLRVMIFQSRTALEIWAALFASAARVYAVIPHQTSRLLLIPVDYFS